MMTKEEKLKKAEEKARRKAEVQERRIQRKAQFDALKRYWCFHRYDVDARSCAEEFYLFWARQIIYVTPYIINGLACFFDYIRHLLIVGVVVAILALIFPPVLFLVEISILGMFVAVIWIITMALLGVAWYFPIFMAAIKRRINDVSLTAVDAHLRFVLFVVTVAAIFGAVIVCVCSWVDIPAFTSGPLAWLVDMAYVVIVFGLVPLVGQMHYYTTQSGVNGDNFAGPNPVETPLTEESLVGQGGHLASRSWQILSLALIGCAIVISFALSHAFVDGLRVMEMFDVVLKTVSTSAIGVILYSMQVLLSVTIILVVVTRARVRKGDLCGTEIACINACFRSRFTEVTDDLRNQVNQIEEGEAQKPVGGLRSIIGVALKLFYSPFYYVLMCITIFHVVKNIPVLAVLLLVLLFVSVACYNVFTAKLDGSVGTVNVRAVILSSVRQFLDWGRMVIIWPFAKSSVKSGEKLPLVTKKRLVIRNVALIDPFGIHNFALRRYEMGGVQLIFCLSFIGIPVSWLWSIFDAVRFTRMSDEEFLVENSDYCVSKGLGNWFLTLMSKLSKQVILLFVITTVITLSQTLGKSHSQSQEASQRKVLECEARSEHADQSALREDPVEENQGTAKELLQVIQSLPSKEIDSISKEFNDSISKEIDNISKEFNDSISKEIDNISREIDSF